MKTLYTILISFFIVSGLVKAQNYDYLIITPDVFLYNATWDTELMNLQTSRGFNPLIVTVSIQTTAQQIKNTIQNYYNNNPLKYVLLMGNAKNIQGPPYPDSVLYQYLDHGIVNPEVDYINGTYIPFFSVASNNPWAPGGISNVATDDPYVSGLTSHGPVYIGRAPVTSVTEANNYVSKLSEYYQSLDIYTESKNREILLNLDITFPANGCTGGLVTYINEKVKNENIPASITAIELNTSEHSYDGCNPFERCEAREQLFEDTLNQGAAVISLLATGGWVDDLGRWYNSVRDFSGLTNKNTGMPFLFAPNCSQGEVNNPDGYESAMRKLMVHNNGGIIGSIAPTNGSEQHANGHLLYKFNDLIHQDETLTYGEIFKILKDELFTNFPVFEYYNNSLTYFGDPALVPSIFKHRSGFITSDKTLSGNIVVDDFLGISTTGNLTLLPGTNLFFKNDASFYVYGTLNAVGTPEQKITFNKDDISDTWGPISFISLYTTNSILDNVKILNATEVSCLSGSDITITNSLLDHCTQGIYIYNSEPQIIDNEFIEPYGNGIYGEANGKSPLIKGNSIKKINRNLYNYQGIYLLNFTSPLITENDIQGFMYGIYYGGGGSGSLTNSDFSTPSINNRLANNVYGLGVAWGSYLIAGHAKSPSMGSKNSIIGSISHDARVYESATVIARQNWWDTDGAQLYVYSNGYIDVSNPLLSDPWDGIPLRPTEEDNTKYVIPIEGDPVNFEDIFTGIDLESNGNITSAVAHYKNMIRKTSHPKFALGRLAGIKKKFSLNEIQQYLETLLSSNASYKPAALNLIAGMYLDDDRYEEAMQLYNIIINQYPESYDATNALFEKFFAALHVENNITLASQLFSELQSLNITDEDFLMRLDLAESVLNGTPSNGLFKGSTAESKENETNLPKEYSLLGNYPNPFNPSTTISYALPYQSSVELIVYDIMGAKVKSFAIPSQSAGYQNILWDGRNENGNAVSSGVYIYRFNIKSLENNQAFVKSAKLMLMK